MKIKTNLPQELSIKKSLKASVPYAKQTVVVKYKSFDTSIAKVSKNGTVKAKGKGKVKITVQIKLADGKVKKVKKNITVK